MKDIKSRIWKKKEGKYAKFLAKIQVTAILLKRDMRRNVLLKFIEICIETQSAFKWVLLQKRKFISRGTQKH